jgi:hypothetical protein
LSDDEKTPGQIALFTSFFRFDRFRSLRSLTLLDVADDHLHDILIHLTDVPLSSLTIKSRQFFTWKTTTLAYLSTLLERPSLRELTLHIWCFEIYDRLTFEQYCSILDGCVALRTFVIKDVLWNDPTVLGSIGYSQLTSLTLEDNRMDIARLELFLSLTPALTSLRIIGMAYLNDGQLWEKILQTKLPHLQRFEFFFLSWKNVNYDMADTQSLIQPYQTTFWLTNKRCFINCDYVSQPAEVMIYTLPICKSSFQHHHRLNQTTCTNQSQALTESMIISEFINELRVNVSKALVHEEKVIDRCLLSD